MARTVDQILAEMYAYKATKTELDVLTSTSSVAIWRLIFYVCAVAVWTLENLFDTHKKEVEVTLTAMRPHTSSWYIEKVKGFMLGATLTPETGQYETGYTDEEIAQMKIISHCAVVENNTGKLLIKVAKTASNALTKLTTNELLAVSSYVRQIKDAGVAINLSSLDADVLKLNVLVYVDSLYIDQYGYSTDVGEPIVQDAITAHLQALPFNAEFTKMGLVDALQNVRGVKVVEVISAEAKPAAGESFSNITIYVAEAGYMRLDTDNLTLTIVAH